MIGRFINHEGKQKNLPTVRFGNISMMPDEPIADENDIQQESFLVECRSIPGYSGSPVFVLILPGTPRPTPEGWVPISIKPSFAVMGLLGIDWCHISDFNDVLEGDRKTKASGHLVVRGNTGMAGVIPAWKITDMLNSERFSKLRREDDEKISKMNSERPSS